LYNKAKEAQEYEIWRKKQSVKKALADGSLESKKSKGKEREKHEAAMEEGRFRLSFEHSYE
jgi:hypothetical protein